MLDGVSVGVAPGQVVGLLGPNGAGKTTSFYMMCGLSAPDRGRIYLDGRDVTRLPLFRRARLGLGYLPQESSIFRGLSVADNILAALEVVEKNALRRHQRLDALLEDFGLTHLAKSPSIALSGGERRRVEIARALAVNPKYILLDEPFAGIDPIAVQDIRTLVLDLKRRGLGVLITDHNVHATLKLVDYAYILHGGHILKGGKPAEIAADDTVRDVYLGRDFVL